MSPANPIPVVRRKSNAVDILPALEKTDAKKTPFIELPAHAARDSLLHSGSGFDNYRGLYNLALLALVVSSVRVAIENLYKYGILVNPMEWIRFLVSHPEQVECVKLASLLPVLIGTSLLIEKAAAKRIIPSSFANFLHWINILFVLIFPCVVILLIVPHPIFSSMVLFHYCIYFFKLISYVDVNKHYRGLYLAAQQQQQQSGNKQKENHNTSTVVTKPTATATTTTSTSKASATDDDTEDLTLDLSIPKVEYPNNLTVYNIFYFSMVPTLCYELNYPRNRVIRKRFLARRIFEFLFFSIVSLSLAQQWIVPTVNNTVANKEPSVLWLIERTLKLSLPNNILWLAFFYCYFHSYMNIMGEIFRFADRQFYRDWWNATTIDYFWRNWNIPVHKWAFRHVYQPFLAAGFSKPVAQLAVFLLSAFFHELLVSVPLHMFKLWFFASMLFQIPLAILTSKILKNTQYGNIVVWASLVIGQPAGIMMYVQAYINST